MDGDEGMGLPPGSFVPRRLSATCMTIFWRVTSSCRCSLRWRRPPTHSLGPEFRELLNCAVKCGQDVVVILAA